MDIKELNEAFDKFIVEEEQAIAEEDIQKVVDAINKTLEAHRFQNMDVAVDEGAFEPSVTIFTVWGDEFNKKQAELIDAEFNVFKTTDHMGLGDVWTEEDVVIPAEDERAEATIKFVGTIVPGAEINEESIQEFADAYVQQLDNFWDEIYNKDMLDESVESKGAKARVLKEENAYSTGGYISLDIPSKDIDAICVPGPADDAIEALCKEPYIRKQLDEISDEELEEWFKDFADFDDEERAEKTRLDKEHYLVWDCCWNAFEDDERVADYDLDKAFDLYKKNGMLFMDTEEGKEAYDILYKAGYTMKNDGDIAHCIELNKAGAGLISECFGAKRNIKVKPMTETKTTSIADLNKAMDKFVEEEITEEKEEVTEDLEYNRKIWDIFEENIAEYLKEQGIKSDGNAVFEYISKNAKDIVKAVLDKEYNYEEDEKAIFELYYNCPIAFTAKAVKIGEMMEDYLAESIKRCLTIEDKMI